MVTLCVYKSEFISPVRACIQQQLTAQRTVQTTTLAKAVDHQLVQCIMNMNCYILRMSIFALAFAVVRTVCMCHVYEQIIVHASRDPSSYWKSLSLNVRLNYVWRMFYVHFESMCMRMLVLWHVCICTENHCTLLTIVAGGAQPIIITHYSRKIQTHPANFWTLHRYRYSRLA